MPELIFFDTFSHDSSGNSELNLDLVQFPSPVYVEEVRVIPLGARVKANFPGGVRLGATNPTKFDLEFFVNNLRAPGASTFESIGVLKYNQHGQINMHSSAQIATDGLVLRGFYSTITLAVYGTISDSTPDQLARQGNAQAAGIERPALHNSVVVKEEPAPKPPELPDNGRTVGESYTAAWTEKHSQADGWIQPERPDWAEGRVKPEFEVKSEIGINDYDIGNNGSNGDGKELLVKGEEFDNDTKRHSLGREFPNSGELRLSAEDFRKTTSADSRTPVNNYPREGGHWGNNWVKSREGSLDRRQTPEPNRRSTRSRSPRRLSRSRSPREYDRSPTHRRLSAPRSLSPRPRRSLTPRRSLSPRRRSLSPRSPITRLRSRTPPPRGLSPRTRTPPRSRSPGHGTRIPAAGSRSTPPRSRSPVPRSRSPVPRSRSPVPRSRSPIPRSRSPARYSRSPIPRTRTSVPRSTRSPGFRSRERSPLPRNGSPQRSVTPVRRLSRSPKRNSGGGFARRSYSPQRETYPFTSSSPLHRSTSRNGHPSSVSPRSQGVRSRSRSPVREKSGPPAPRPLNNSLPIIAPTDEDILDNVSDISEGDIPDVPEPDTPETPIEPVENNIKEEEESIRNSIVREDVEEISDEEAEWSDDVETAFSSDFDFDKDFGEDWEDPIKMFDIYNSKLKELTILNGPTERNAIKTSNVELKTCSEEGVRTEKSFADLIEILGDYSENEIDDKWVEHVENLTRLLQSEPPLECEMTSGVTSTMVKTALFGLDADLATRQVKATYKVRHTKSGLKYLVEVSQCGNELLGQLLSNQVQDKLIQLYNKEFMATSLKLLMLRVLDLTLNHPEGIPELLGRGAQKYKESVFEQINSLIISSKQPTRTKFALSSILIKCNLSEQLKKLSNLIQLVQDTTAPSVQEMLNGTDRIPENVNGNDGVSEHVFEEIEEILQQLRTTLSTVQLTMSQPSRFLPGGSHFSFSDKQFHDPYSGFFQQLDNHILLQNLVILLSCPLTSDHDSLTSSLQALLEQILSVPSGLLYLASRPDQTNALIAILLAIDEPLDDTATNGSLCGLTIGHQVHAVQCIDTLMADILRADNRKDMETAAMLEAVQTLYGMTFTSVGRQAVVDVLTINNHMDVLITLVKHSSQEGKKDMKKSAVRGYASELLLLTIRTTDNVPFLEKYAGELIALGKHDEHSKLAELASWTSVLQEDQHFKHEGIPSLCEVVKKNMENVSPMSYELVTSVKLLKHLAVPPDITPSNIPRWMRCVEMKYKYAAISMFSHQLLSTYTAILDKINSYHEQPHLHTATFVGQNGAILVSVIGPIIATMRTILEYLISCRDTHFQDLSCVGSLLRTHTLLAVVPVASVYYTQVQECRLDVIRALNAFTQPAVDFSKDDLTNSLWSKMLGEVINYIMSSPCVQQPGLTVLCELLPLPLPIPSPRNLTDQEVSVITNNRKLWSAHLHGLGPALGAMIGDMAGCGYPGLVQQLQRLCEQLGSLAPLTAGIVASAVIKAVPALVKEDSVAVGGKLLCFLSWMCAQPTLKTVLLHQLLEPGPSEDLMAALSLCLTSNMDSVSWLAAQDSAVSAILALCDPEITLRAVDPGIPITAEEYDSLLADSLPGRDLLVSLIHVLLDHLAADSRNFSAHSVASRTLVMLTESNYTFYHLKQCLEAKQRTFHSFLRKLAVAFSATSVDCLATLSATLTLLGSLLDTLSSDNGLPPRTLTMSVAGLAAVVQWTMLEDTSQQAIERKRTHPLTVLHNRVKESQPIDEELQTTSVKLGCLLSRLDNIQVSSESDLSEEVVLPPSATPLQLWAGQPVTVPVLDGDEEQLTAGYWLSNNSLDNELGMEAEDGVECDLLEVCQRYLATDLDIVLETKEVCKEKSLATERKKKMKKSAMETKTIHNKNLISTFKAGGSVTLRGRGFPRTAFNRHDPFRARPPNTSRPPSLHVDDFLVLELKGQQPTGPTGYNKQSIKAAKELFAQREADAALKPPAQLREATREPVTASGFRGGRGRGEARGSRGFRGSNGPRTGGFRRDTGPNRSYSPGGEFRTSEPREAGRGFRPGPRSEERRFRGARGGGGDRRGGGWPDRRGRDRFGRGRGQDREDRPRHLRSLTR